MMWRDKARKILQIKLLDRDTFLLALLIFVSNDTYMFGTNSNSTIVSIPRYLLLLFCVIELFIFLSKVGRIRINKMLVSYLCMIIVFVIVSYYHNESFNRAFIKVLCITAGWLICCKIPFEKFKLSYNKIMYFICWCAIALTMLAYVMPGVVKSFPVVINTAGTKIYTILVSGLLSGMVDNVLIRTMGIFWEPGVFQIYINIAICFSLFSKTEKNMKHLFVYICALLLTFSTAGYIVCGWLFVTYCFFERKETKSKQNMVAVFILMLIVVLCLYMIMDMSIIWETVFGKLFDETSGTAMVRKASVFVNLDITMDYPLWGIGMEHIEEEFIARTQASSFYYGWTNQNTNTLLYQFAAHGCIFGLLFFVGSLKFGKNLSNKPIVVLCIFISFVLMYIGENLSVSILPYIIVFYGYKSMNNTINHRPHFIYGGN